MSTVVEWVTDFLGDPTAIFTFALFIVTLLLWLATRGLVRGAEQTAERQLRAYVFLDSISLFDGGQLNQTVAARNPHIDATAPTGRHRENVPVVGITIKNSGQTPAYRVTNWIGIDVIEPRLQDALAIPPLDGGPRSVIPPGGTSNSSRWFGRALSPTEITDIDAGRRAVFVFGRIEYLDAFGYFRFTNFRLQYTGLYPPLGAVVFDYSPRGNDTEQDGG